MIAELKGQPTWHSLGRPDLRTLHTDFRLRAIPEQPACLTAAAAEAFLAMYLRDTPHIQTPCGAVSITQEQLPHIVSKRRDARERFIDLAVATMQSPFEIWRVRYDDCTTRLAFIGVTEQKDRQMLVIVTEVSGKTLWNYMHSDAKSLNKHRHGELLYSAYSPFSPEP